MVHLCMFPDLIVTNYCLLLQDWDEAYARNLDEFEGRTRESQWDRYWRMRHNPNTNPHLTVLCFVTGKVWCGTPVGLHQSGTSSILTNVCSSELLVLIDSKI